MSSIINLQSLNVGTAFPPGMQDGSGGLQTYVDQSSTLSAVNGAPSAGQFRSSIVNRAAIPDIAADLKVSLGVDRIMIQQIAEIQGEFGQSGERVFGAVNDDKGLIRFVGNWSRLTDDLGSYVSSTTTNDYIEIVFYGTGLNLLYVANATTPAAFYSIDGASEVAVSFLSASSVLANRNYAINSIVGVVSGLSLGLHTIKIRNNSSNALRIYGFEVLNTSASINVNPGSAYSQFKKNTLSSAVSASYNITFDQIVKDGSITGSLGTRGARALVYLDTDGAVKKRAVAVNSAQGNIASADHTNEEVIRKYHFREFGAGRSDDFSLQKAADGNVSRAFTLDDGTTTLVTNTCIVSNYNSVEVLDLNGATGTSSVTFTFVGTGLDFITANNGGASGTTTFYIDGVSIGSYTLSSTSPKQVKVVSGLPYGTHTFKMLRETAAQPNVQSFVVYGPKKPSLPSGAIELADYNVMADFVANTTPTLDTISRGVIRKSATREITFVNGTGGSNDWAISGLSPSSDIGGFNFNTNRQNAYFQYTFFGTGLDLRFSGSSVNSTNIQVSLSGTNLTSTNFPTASFSVYGNGVVFNSTTGILDQADASPSNGNGFVVSGLPLGLYTIKLLNNTASSYIIVNTIDVITPIYSPKSNLNADFQNTLSVGSQSIGDSRKFSVVKDVPGNKAWAQAVGIASSPSTASTSPIPMPDMSVTIKTNGSPLQILFRSDVYQTASNGLYTQIYVNGIAVGALSEVSLSGTYGSIQNIACVPVSSGTHKVDIYWYVSGGAGALTNTFRTLFVREL